MSRPAVYYGSEPVELDLPSGWELVADASPMLLPALAPEQIAAAIDAPTGTAPLSDLARGRATAALVVSDTTRPIHGGLIIPFLLDRLNAGGIPDDRITIVVGGGSHTQPADWVDEFRRRHGAEAASRCRLVYHNCDEDLVEVGVTARGNRVLISQHVATADLVVTFGEILPHPVAGYSGGAKNLVPGVAGRATIVRNHVLVGDARARYGAVDDNPLRQDLEEAAGLAGLAFICNVVLNVRNEIAGVVAGHYVAAHRAGCTLAEQMFRTDVERPAEVVICSGYPMDVNLYQSLKGASHVVDACRDGGTIVHCTPAYGGLREQARELFRLAREHGYRRLFELLHAGDWHHEAVRRFIYPEINIGGSMTIFRAMVERDIRFVIASDGVTAADAADLGMRHTPTVAGAIALLAVDQPTATVALARSSHVLLRCAQPLVV